jgi:uroporphyrinogen decarboxylase
VDCGHILSRAPIDEVVATVKQCIRDGAPGGGFVLMSSNSLHSSVRAENYRAMVETAHRYGTYPLDLP